VQLSLKLKNAGGNDAQQNVSTDANANIVITHVVVDGADVTLCNDFDKVRQFCDTYTQHRCGKNVVQTLLLIYPR
jgi:hypothetical protein